MSECGPRDSRFGQPGAVLPAWPCALAVIAHPDDESFGLGAVIDELTAAGAAVHIVCYTHGGPASQRPNWPITPSTPPPTPRPTACSSSTTPE